MNKLRKAGSVLTAGVLAATVSVAGVTAASAETYDVIVTDTTSGYQYISDLFFDSDSLSTSVTFRTIPIAGYKTVEIGEDNHFTAATWTYNGNLESETVATAGIAGMAGADQASMEDIVAWIAGSDENAQAFASAAKEVSGWATRGTEVRYVESNGRWETTGENAGAIGSKNSTSIAGLHLVYAPDGEFEPFLISTQVYVNVNGGETGYVPANAGDNYDLGVWNIKTAEGGGGDTSITTGITVALVDQNGNGYEGVQVSITKAYDSTNGLNERSGTTDANGTVAFNDIFYYTGNSPQTTTFDVDFIDPRDGSQRGPRFVTVLSYNNGVLNIEDLEDNGNNLPGTYDPKTGVLTIVMDNGQGSGATGLPVTGAAGIGALVVVALLALGGGLALRRKKYQTADEA